MTQRVTGQRCMLDSVLLLTEPSTEAEYADLAEVWRISLVLHWTRPTDFLYCQWSYPCGLEHDVNDQESVSLCAK